MPGREPETGPGGSGARGRAAGASLPTPDAFGFFGVSFGLGISLGGVTGVIGPGPGAQGLAAQHGGVVSQPHECFREPIRPLILSSRFGRAELVAHGSQPHDGDFAPNFALNRSSSLTRPAEAHGSQQFDAGAGAAQHPPAWITVGALSPHPAGMTSPPEARADDITSNAAFMSLLLLWGLGTGKPAGNLPGVRIDAQPLPA